MAKGDKIKGGLTDKWSVEDVAKKHGVGVKGIENQLKKGIEIEFEHTKDKAVAREIALDHLYEIPDYYNRLDNMEKEAKKEMKEGKENITDFARRMRELAGLAEGNQAKSLKTVQEGESSFESGATFKATDVISSNEKSAINESVDSKDEEFETHQFEQKAIEEGEEDKELYTLNENTVIVLDFLDEEESN
jgi:cell division protein YceG involved in septum cleavage